MNGTAEELAKQLIDSGQTVATAESCTGGMLGMALTSVSGSSAYYIGGVIAYEDAVKQAILGVRHETLKTFGAVSEPTAREMAEEARDRLGADFSLSVTGIAGPTGGTPEKPVGTVFIGMASGQNTCVRKFHFEGSRQDVRQQAVDAALQLVLDQFES